MVTSRFIDESDRPTLEYSLAKDEYHKETTTSDFFYAPGTVCAVHSDEQMPIMFVRGTKAMRVDIQFVDNNDFERNKKALVEGFEPFVEQCRSNGFTEIVFCSDNPALIGFCKKYFGYEEVNGELRKFL